MDSTVLAAYDLFAALALDKTNYGSVMDNCSPGAGIHHPGPPTNRNITARLGQPTLVSLASLLSTAEAAAIGWIHFLAFDLFVGRWVYLDSREYQISAWLASPVLFFVFMFGPFGFVLYWLLRFFFVRKA